MNTHFCTLCRVKRLFHALADVFLVDGALRYLWDVQVAYEAIADFDSLGAVSACPFRFVDDDLLHEF